MSSEESEDLNTLVGKLANLMTDTIRSCIGNYKALLPYLGKKQTNSEIRHKLVRVNVLLNKLNEELLALRVEYVTVSSFEQKMETVLPEGGRKRISSDVLVSGRLEAKSIKMEVPFFSNTKCSVALNSEAEINIQSENLVLNNTEGTRHSQLQTLEDMHNVNNIKKEIEDSNEAEDIHELPINNSQILETQKSCDTKTNEMTVHFAGDDVSANVAYRLVESNTYDKSADTINGVYVPLQSVKNETSNQPNCEEGGNILSKDHDIYKGLKGENVCTTSFSYQAKPPLNSKESVTLTACEKESAVLVEERANSFNKRERRSLRSPIRYKKDDVPAQARAEEKDDVPAKSRVDDVLYGIIKVRKGMFKCILCNRRLFCETTVSLHVRGKRHKKARTTVKKNDCTKESEDVPYGIIKIKNGMYRCTLCNRKLVCDTAMLGHVRGNQHKTALITAKNNGCTKEYKVRRNRCKIEFVNYQAVQGNMGGKENKMKQKTAKKNSCSKELKVQRNNSESAAQVSVCSAVAYSRADTVQINNCGSTASVSPCSAVPCSLADNVFIVEDRCQVISMKPAVMLNNIWTHFYAPFHINKKFFQFNSGQIICSLCYEQVGRYILNVRAHISESSHLDRINILRNIELENKSSNKQLLDIPGSLKNIVPAAQFSWINDCFFCNVCKCFFENTVVLSHMTGKSHGKKKAEMEKDNVELTTVTVQENLSTEGKV